MLKDKLQADLKEAMLSRDKAKVDVLKGLKSAILYAEVEQGKRDKGLSDEEALVVLKKEAKKRQDSIELYQQAGDQERMQKETSEKELIESYLPAQLDEQALLVVIDEVLQELNISKLDKKDMGKVIGAVKQKVGTQADGALIAKKVSEKISS